MLDRIFEFFYCPHCRMTAGLAVTALFGSGWSLLKLHSSHYWSQLRQRLSRGDRHDH